MQLLISSNTIHNAALAPTSRAMNERIIRRSYFCQASKSLPTIPNGSESFRKTKQKKMMLEVDTQVIQMVLRMLNVY